mgnify:CR=1 FL=1
MPYRLGVDGNDPVGRRTAGVPQRKIKPAMKHEVLIAAIVYIVLILTFILIIAHRLKTGWSKGSAHWVDRAVENIKTEQETGAEGVIH